MEAGLKFKIGVDDTQVTPAFNKLGQQLQRTTNQMGSLRKGTADATYTLSNLSRVAQDAPYGFIGIANNLNPLLEGFQRLKAESGSTKVALQSLITGLTGPAGIGLALGVVSSLLIQFGDQLFKSKSSIDANALALERMAQQAEVASQMVDELNKSLSNTNKVAKLNLEANIGVGSSADLMDLQAQSVQQRGVIRTAEAALAQLKTIKDNAEDLLRSNLTPEQQRAFSEGLLGAFAEDLSKGAKKAYDVFLDAEKKFNDGVKQLKQEASKEQELYALIRLKKNTIEEEAAKKAKEAADKEEAALKKHLAEMAKLAEQKRRLAELWARLKFEAKAPIEDDGKNEVPGGPEDQSQIDRYIKSLERLSELENRRGSAGATTTRAELDQGKEDFDKWLSDIKEQRKQWEDLAHSISSKVAPAFQAMYKAILAGESPLKAFFKGLGQAVMDLIDQLIAAAIQAAILSLISGGAAGGGISFAGALKNIIGGGGGFGGRAQGAVGSPGGLGGRIEVFGRLSGRDIVLAGVRDNRLNGRR